jgi:hypothetical protein
VSSGKISTKAKATRSGHRGAFTKLVKKFEDGKSNEEFDRDELATILDLFLDKQKLLSELNSQIISELSEEELEGEIIESDEYCLNLEMEIRKMRKYLQPAAHAATHSSSVPVTQNSLNPLAEIFDINRNHFIFISQQMYEPIPCSNSQFIKLPKLEMKTFDDNILNWQSFCDSYETAVHSNHSLSDAQQFNYLKSLLENEAFSTVSGNYYKAIEILHQRFGQTQKITHTYMQASLNLPAPVNTVQSCRNFYDKSETLIRGLESLGQSQESYGALLVPVMMNKLSSKIKENITREHGLIQWSLENLRQILFKEISIMEAGQTITLHSEEPTMSTVYLAKTNTPSN